MLRPERPDASLEAIDSTRMAKNKKATRQSPQGETGESQPEVNVIHRSTP
jgi:hypothetical protein